MSDVSRSMFRDLVTVNALPNRKQSWKYKCLYEVYINMSKCLHVAA